MLENKTDDNIMYAELSEILKMMEPKEENLIHTFQIIAAR